jgi:hypothetical protein
VAMLSLLLEITLKKLLGRYNHVETWQYLLLILRKKDF